eukprot:g8183.t3
MAAQQELVEQQAALERRKAELREQKNGQYRQKQAALQRRIKELDQSALEHRKARHAALRRMAELQKSEENFELRRLEYQRETWEVERALQLEKLVRQIRDVQPIEEQRRKLEDEQRLRLLRLDAIEAEKLRRWREKERQLKDSLHRSKHLQEHAGRGRSDPVALALEAGEEYGEGDEEEEGPNGIAGSGLAKIAAEIDIVRRRAARESVRAHEALRRELNEQRVRLAGETDSVQLKMQQVRAEQAGGLAAFARGELGPAAFQILATPAPPEVASTWWPKARGNNAESKSRAPGRKRRGSSDVIGTSRARDEEVDDHDCDNDDGSTSFRDGDGRAKDGTAEARDENDDDDDDDGEQREARDDMSRSAAVAAFLGGSAAAGRTATPATARAFARNNASRRRRGQVLVSPSVTEGDREVGGFSATQGETSKKQEKRAPERVRRENSKSHGGGGGGGRYERATLRQARGLSRSGSTEDEESGEEEKREESVALDVEELVADLRERDGEVVSRIEALRSQAEALAKEEEWLATGSLGKGHAWETVSRLAGDGEKLLLGGGNDPHDARRLTLEADRINLEVAKRVMEEETRLAKKEADLLTAASVVLEEHVSAEVRAVHTELMSASNVALDVVGAALASSAAGAAARSRVQGGGGGSSSGGDSTISGAASTRTNEPPIRPRLPPGPVEGLLLSAFRDLLDLGTTDPGKAAGGKGEAGGDGGTGHTVATASKPVVLRLKDIQPYRPPRSKELPKGERFYFAHVSAERFYLAIPKGDGLVTSIAMGPPAVAPSAPPTTGAPAAATAGAGAGAAAAASTLGGTFLLAAGTNKGGIAVWAMPWREEEGGGTTVSTKKSKGDGKRSGGVLVRVASPATMPKEDRCPVTHIKFGADGRSQLVSLDSQRTVKVWDIGGGHDAIAALRENHPRRGGGRGGAAVGAGGGSSKAAARDFLPELRGSGGGAFTKFQAVPLVPRWTIRGTNLTRPLLNPSTTCWLEGSVAGGPDPNVSASNKKRGNDKRRAKGGEGLGRGQDAGTASASTLPSVGGDGLWPASTKRNTDATAVSFHTAMTAFGHHPSVVIGTAGGSLVKCNSDAWMAAAAAAASGDGEGDGTAGADVVYGKSSVSIEPGERGAPQEAALVRSGPSVEGEEEGGGKTTGGNRVRREFFERHRHPVVFVGFQDRVSLTMVTLDTSGLLCVWPYGADAFSGFGWYTPSKEVLVDVTLHMYTLETKRPGGKVGRSGAGGAAGDGEPEYIFNRALPPESSEYSDPQEALAELRAGGYRLWSTMPGPARGRADTYLASLDGRGGSSRGTRDLLPAIVARYDAEGELKSASRFRASEGSREGTITDAKLTVSGGELAILATYRPLAHGSGIAAGANGITGAASSPRGAGDSSTLDGGAAPQGTAMVFLVDLQSLRLLPQHVRHDWLTADANSFPPPAFAVSPVLDATGSDYVYLTIGDSIRVFSLETGFESMLQGGRRLSTNTRADGDATRGENATPAAIAAAATPPIVAAEVSPDNRTLAVVCAGSGAVNLFRLHDNSTQAVSQYQQDEHAAPRSSGEGGAVDKDGHAWRTILRDFACDRRDATPWETRVHLTTPFMNGDFEDFGHRNQIRHVIVGEMIVEAALALCEKNRIKNRLLGPVEGGETLVSANGGAPGCVSLRALLGKPPYGTV